MIESVAFAVGPDEARSLFDAIDKPAQRRDLAKLRASVQAATYALVRQRSLRPALHGAWLAAQLGSSFVEPYLDTIVDSRDLLRTFDAIIAATAIAVAVATPVERDEITRRLERLLWRRIGTAEETIDRPVIEACHRSVRVALHDAAAAEELTLKRGLRVAGMRYPDRKVDCKTALFYAIDDPIDAASIDEDGFMPVLVALPAIVNAKLDAFFVEPGKILA